MSELVILFLIVGMATSLWHLGREQTKANKALTREHRQERIAELERELGIDDPFPKVCCCPICVRTRPKGQA